MTVEKTEKPKRKNTSKKKGNGFELTVAKLLSKELAPMNFIRTPGSGARVGGKNFATIGQMFGEEALKIFVGDVVPVNEKQIGKKFKVSCECKFYATQDHFTSVMMGSGLIFKWMKESEDDAQKIDKLPILIFKWNHTPIFIACTNDNMPHECIKMVLPRENLPSIKVGILEDVLKHKDFWIE